ncbi:MAG: 1-acyl-sn-glycerol-3-phosphate acyltransferase [Candidatus Obscuribacterales bacterium]|nr:1-acyl-sn-glycerol-3-phosphate acyltransferase [Candidatus Obscuribacterales bacterium]
MPTLHDKNAFTPFRAFYYLMTARYFFGPLFFFQNRLEFSGRENIPKEGPCVFVANHLSNWDPPIIARATDKPVSFLAKEELFTDKFFRNLVRAYGAISVNRDKPEPSTFKAVRDMLKKGWYLGMFIEGTRSKTPGQMGPPHLGPAYFAKANKLPIVPVGIVGTNVKNGKAYVRIGKPLEASKDLDETTWRIMEALSDLTGFKLPPRELPLKETESQS